jgi:hypothetical protein
VGIRGAQFEYAGRAALMPWARERATPRGGPFITIRSLRTHRRRGPPVTDVQPARLFTFDRRVLLERTPQKSGPKTALLPASNRSGAWAPLQSLFGNWKKNARRVRCPFFQGTCPVGGARLEHRKDSCPIEGRASEVGRCDTSAPGRCTHNLTQDWFAPFSTIGKDEKGDRRFGSWASTLGKTPHVCHAREKAREVAQPG